MKRTEGSTYTESYGPFDIVLWKSLNVSGWPYNILCKQGLIKQMGMGRTKADAVRAARGFVDRFVSDGIHRTSQHRDVAQEMFDLIHAIIDGPIPVGVATRKLWLSGKIPGDALLDAVIDQLQTIKEREFDKGYLSAQRKWQDSAPRYTVHK
jgi:hypothetical protein